MKREGAGNGSDAPASKFQRSSSDTSSVVVRFLIPCRAAGIMIGKGGENIKKIRSKFNVKLNIPDNRGPERIMTIEGDLQAICDVLRDVSPKLKDIINAKLSDPRRIMGNFVPRRRGRPGQEHEEPEKEEDDDSMLDYRILVHESQAGSVIGRGGERIKELRDKYRMRVIKVYQMLAPMSTDRVVQMVSDPENAISCLFSVVEAVESAPPRGRREEYDAGNFCEADALNYGGWLSREAAQALSQGVPLSRPGGMPPMGYNPYMMGSDMGPPPPGGMGGHGPMGGGRGPPGPGRGPRSGGNMMGGPRGPTPVPPPGAPRSNAPPSGNMGGYGAASGGQYGSQGPMPSYDGSGGYDNGAMYGGVDQTGQSGYGSQGYGAPPVGNYGSTGYGAGSQRGTGDMTTQAAAPRGGNYGGYGSSNPGMHEDPKANQWYGGWA